MECNIIRRCWHRSFVFGIAAIGLFFTSTAVASTLVGSTSGEFNVNESGAATYAIPLNLPSGIAGVTPQLAFVYDSQNGNGLLGQGWQLEGLSTISRCRPTIEVEGIVSAEPSRFCLDGQKLIAVNGQDYGSDGAEYRTEIDSFQKIISYGEQNGYPQWFKVWRKDGSVSEYGNTDDARIEGQGGSAAMVWAINSTQSSVQNANNRIVFAYNEDNTNGSFSLNTIAYAGGQVSVQMHYGGRTDTSVSYMAGVKTSLRQRLAFIAVQLNGRLYRQYNLGYQYDSVTQQSQITTLTECVSTGCLPPTTFQWEQTSQGYHSAESLALKNEFSYAKTADLNADGRQDVVVATLSNKQTTLYTYYGDNDTLIERGSGLSVGEVNKENWQLFDYNGDGFTDLIVKGSDTWKIYNGSENGFTHEVFDTGIVSDNAYLADQNADGLVDLVYNLRATSGYQFTGGGRSLYPLVSRNIQYLTLSDEVPSDYPYRLSPAVSIPVEPIVSGSTTWQPIQVSQKVTLDFNGDGRIDALQEVANGNTASWKITQTASLGGTVTDSVFDSNVTDGENTLFLDVNGDGLPDKIGRLSQTDRSFNVYLNTGKGFTYYAPFDVDMTELDVAKSLSFNDYNGDGALDVHYIRNNTHWVQRWQGSGYGSAIETGLHYVSVENNLFIDINGDGRRDYMHIAKNGSATLQLARGGSAGSGRISAITNGLEAKTRIHYALLTESGVYSKGLEAAQQRWGRCPDNQCSPVFDVIGPFSVVSRVYSDLPATALPDAVAGQSNQSGTAYRYGAARMQSGGRGFLGYASFTVTDLVTGVVTETHYHQDFPFSGMPKGTTVRTANGHLLTESINTWNHKQHGQVYQPSLKQSVERGFDLNTHHRLKTVMVSQEVDDYGNVLSLVSTTEGNGVLATTTTTNHYSNNEANWQIGHLVQKQVTTAMNGSSVTRTSGFDYDSANGLLVREMLEPGDQLFSTTKTYSYDGVGNIIGITLSGQGVADRTTETQYTSDGWYVARQANALGQIVSEVFERDAFGRPLVVSDINGVQTTFSYDALGRKLSERHASGSGNAYAYYTCNNSPVNCPISGAVVLEVDPIGKAPSWEVQDVLGRALRKVATGFDGSKIVTDNVYDQYGRAAKVSQPYKEGDTVYWNTSEYDLLGRTLAVTNASGYVESTNYTDYTTTIINPLSQQKTEVRNVLGQLVQVIDNLNNTVDYTYDAQGHLIRTLQTAADTGATAETTITYDRLGRKVAMDDEDKGRWHYEYDVFGQLIEQTDAKGQKLQLTYDGLGRKLNRIDRRADGSIEGNTAWVYDQDTLGVLASVKDSVSGYVQAYTYDSYGRASKTTTNFDGETYQQLKSYDGVGRLKGETTKISKDSVFNYDYAKDREKDEKSAVEIGDFLSEEGICLGDGSYCIDSSDRYGVRYRYNRYGYMYAVFDTWGDRWSEYALYRINSMNARGNITLQTINGIQQAKDYDSKTGFIEGIRANYSLAMDDGSALQDNVYYWDEAGNLLSRQEKGKTETFTYDALNRLATSEYKAETVRREKYGERIDKQVNCIDFYNLTKTGIDNRGWPLSAERRVTSEERDLEACPHYFDDADQSHTEHYGNEDRVEACEEDNRHCDRLGVGDYAVVMYDVPVTYTEKTVELYRTVDTHTEGYEYDGLGNITYKTGVGDYTYGANGAGAHAVTATSTGAVQYHYDNNGNMVSGGGRSLSYTVFDKPSRIIKGGVSVEFDYDTQRNRYKRVDSSGGSKTVTRYIGNIEFIEYPSGQKEIRQTIAGTIVQSTRVSSGNDSRSRTMNVLLKDHLGSVNAVIDEEGLVVQQNSYSAFGESRNPLSWEQWVTFDETLNRRGFTGHEHLGDLGLIHMNGRIYDPKLGRFLQADPFIQTASHTQSFNRYSYVLNNPLNAIDPSGYFIGKILNAITRPFKQVARGIIKLAAKIVGAEVVNVVGTMVLSAITGPWAPAAVGAWQYEFGRAMGARPNQALRSAVVAGASVWAFGAQKPNMVNVSISVVAARNPGTGRVLAFMYGNRGASLSTMAIQGVGEYMHYKMAEELTRFANRNNLTLAELNLVLAMNSRLGMAVAGGAFTKDEKTVFGFFSRKGGWVKRESLLGGVWDINDSLLVAQGLPDAVMLDIMDAGFTGHLTGHSLGAARVNLLHRMGVVSGATTASLPVFAYPSAGSASACASLDVVCGGGLVSYLRPGTSVENSPGWLNPFENHTVDGVDAYQELIRGAPFR